MVGIVGSLKRDQRLRTGTATLVVRDQGPRGQVFLFGNRLDEPGDLVSATTGTCHDHEIDRFRRFERGNLCRCLSDRERCRPDQSREASSSNEHYVPP